MPSFNQVIRESLHLRWDPIGIGGATALEVGEYDSYAPGICALLASRPSQMEVFEHLWRIETEVIGMSGNRTNTERFAGFLCELNVP